MNKKQLVAKLSWGILDTGIDLVLFAASLGMNLYGNTFAKKDPFTLVADSFQLAAKFKREFLVKTSYYARKKGWLKPGEKQLRLTPAGENLIGGKLPVYRKYRPWDGRLYLVTYDIRESQKQWRDRLRLWLIDHSAKMVQKSVWVTVNDLSGGLEKFQQAVGDGGLVLLSSLRKGEGLGRENIEMLISRLYRLDELNRQYFNFIQAVKKKQAVSDEEKMLAKLYFLSILKQDPQLPRGLLPQAWYGDYAHELYTKL